MERSEMIIENDDGSVSIGGFRFVPMGTMRCQDAERGPEAKSAKGSSTRKGVIYRAPFVTSSHCLMASILARHCS
jgi:hypothetical protein